MLIFHISGMRMHWRAAMSHVVQGIAVLFGIHRVIVFVSPRQRWN
nr:hypothetical protein [Providencia rettgeri]